MPARGADGAGCPLYVELHSDLALEGRNVLDLVQVVGHQLASGVRSDSWDRLARRQSPRCDFGRRKVRQDLVSCRSLLPPAWVPQRHAPSGLRAEPGRLVLHVGGVGLGLRLLQRALVALIILVICWPGRQTLVAVGSRTLMGALLLERRQLRRMPRDALVLDLLHRLLLLALSCVVDLLDGRVLVEEGSWIGLPTESVLQLLPVVVLQVVSGVRWGLHLVHHLELLADVLAWPLVVQKHLALVVISEEAICDVASVITTDPACAWSGVTTSTPRGRAQAAVCLLLLFVDSMLEDAIEPRALRSLSEVRLVLALLAWLRLARPCWPIGENLVQDRVLLRFAVARLAAESQSLLHIQRRRAQQSPRFEIVRRVQVLLLGIRAVVQHFASTRGCVPLLAHVEAASKAPRDVCNSLLRCLRLHLACNF